MATASALAALVDTQGKPVFGDGNTVISPLGFPLVVNVDAPLRPLGSSPTAPESII